MWRQGGISGCKHWNFKPLNFVDKINILKLKLKNVKEYKVVTLKLGFRNRIQKFEDLLNQFAREGWILKEIPQGWNSIVLERDKNR